MAPLSRLDHVIIAVRNLDEAATTYRKLGFTLTPRGLHEGRGTGNHCIMFKDSYIELLGIVDAIGAAGRLAERVNAQGEGGLGIAYGADDADAAAAALRAAGIEVEEPNDLSRPLDLDGKRELVKFRNVMMPGLTLPNVMQFVCTHLTPELTRARHEWQLHPNGAIGIEAITIATDDPAHQQAEAAKLHGNRLTNAKVEIIGHSDAADRFGKTLSKPNHNGIVALAIRVNERDAAAAMLDMGRVPHQETSAAVIVPASATHGVTIAFAED
jgi:catechol 2,3-dioxygenase-like lactoylglutathione lyase family enzyme